MIGSHIIQRILCTGTWYQLQIWFIVDDHENRSKLLADKEKEG